MHMCAGSDAKHDHGNNTVQKTTQTVKIAFFLTVLYTRMLKIQLLEPQQTAGRESWLPLSIIVQYLCSSEKVQTEFLMEELEKAGNERTREDILKF